MEEMMKIMKPYYEKAVAEAKANDTPEKRRGVGLACGFTTEGGTDKASAAIEPQSRRDIRNTIPIRSWDRAETSVR